MRLSLPDRLRRPALAATCLLGLSGFGARAQTIDGTLDAATYGAALSTQSNATGFGDVTSTNQGGSELDVAYGRIANGNLYLLLTGNLETNGNRLELFIDSKTGGQNVLLASNPDVDGAAAKVVGLTFDAGFAADYYLTFNSGGSTLNAFFGPTDGSGGTGTTLVTGAPFPTATLAFSGSVTGQLGFDNSNTAGVTDVSAAGAATATTGIELAIPLAAIGNPTGAVRVAAFINGGGHDYASNQFLGGLPSGTGNLGGDGAGNFTGTLGGVNLTSFAGNQYFTVPAGTSSGPAISVTPSPLAIGSVTVGSTGTGPLTVSNPGTSALTISSITSSNPRFTVSPTTATVAAGGSTTLTVTFAPTVSGAQTGTLTIASNAGGQPSTTVTVTGTGTAATTASVDGTLDAGNVYGSAVALQTTPTGFGDATGSTAGSELDAAYVRVANGKLYLLLTGNLEGNGNDLEIFFDTQTGGQNVLGATNPNVDNNALAKLTGLTFDAGFTPDYYLTVQRNGSGAQAVLTAHYAPLNNAGGNGLTLTNGTTGLVQPLDFGASGTGTVGYNNANVAGVSDVAVGNPGAVTTGLELEIPLAALGNPTGAFRISTFINGGGHDYASNQFLAGLPSGTGNLGGDGAGNYSGTLSGVNLTAFAGNQYFTLSPTAAATPNALALGNVVVGTSGTATFTVTNTGNVPLAVTGITSSNPRFTVTPTTGTVAPGGSLTVTVTFAPTVAGAQTGSLTISTSDPAHATLAVTLTGTGSAPQLAVSPSTLSLGNVLVGATGTATFTVSNPGTAPMTLTGITPSNPRFTVSPTTGTVPAGGSLTITVTFAPTAAGAQTGNLNVNSNGGSATVAVSGTGIAPAISVSPTTIAIGNVTVGATGTGTFTVSNPGSAPLTVTGITSANGVFTVAPTTGTVAPGGSLTVTVTFAPTATGAQTATLTVASNAGPATVTATGTGTPVPAPVLAVSTTTLSVGAVTVGSTGTATFVVSNTGNAPLNLTGITSSNPLFTVAPATGTIAAGGSLTVTVTFAPTTVGPETSTLALTSNGGAATVTVTGTGTAVPTPIIGVAPAALTLGPITVGTTTTATFTISNTGTAPLSLTGISSSDAAFTASPTTGTVAPGGTLTVTVTYAPTTVGTQTGTLTINSNAATATVALTGTATAVPAPVIGVAPATVAIGNVTVGSTGTATFYVRNTGNAPLTLSGITSSNPLFTVAPGTGTVAAGDSLLVTVTFAPTAVGAETGTLTLTSNGGTATVTVTGTGTAVPAPVLAVSPTALAIGPVTVGSTGTGTFVIRNTGNAPLTVGSITSSGGAFTVAPGTGTVAAGDSLVITVTFTPTTPGVQPGVVTVSTNVGAAAVTVTGTAIAAPAPVITATPGALNFGNVAVGSTGTATFYLHNTGNAPLVVSGITVSAPFTATPTAGTIAPGDSLLVTVTFAPTTVGPVTATLTVGSNDPAQAVLPVALTGTGVLAPSVLTTSTDSLTLIASDVPGVGTVTITNTGTTTIQTVTITTSAGVFVVSPATVGPLAPGASVTVTVTFNPGAQNPQTGTITIAAPGQQPVVVAVTGVVIMGLPTSAAAAQLQLYPNPSADGQVTVEWTGNGALPTAPVTVLDALGRVVRTEALTAGRLSLRDLPRGVYVVRVNTPAGGVTRRLVVE